MNPMKIYPGTRLERMAHATGVLSRDFSWAIQYPKGGLLGRSIKGNAPFYFGSLDETAVYSVMARWINMARYPIHKHALDVLSEIRSWDDLCHAIRLALAYSKEATRSLFRRRSRSGQEAD
jgi:hypothetical protein